jgi:glycosyltransferase involved in cell wall biosynthesis
VTTALSVSVIVPAHNAEAFLLQAVQSVREQTWPGSVEIVVCDDGSTDGTAALAGALAAPVVVIPAEGPARGAAAARNRAVAKSRGEFLAFLDADDVWLPDKLALQIAMLEKAQDPAVVFGQAQEFDAQGPLGEYRRCALPSVTLLRRELALRAGLFDESLRLGDFAEWLARLKDLGASFLYVDAPLARRRHHQENLGRRESDRRSDYLEVVRRRMAARRQAAD